MTLKLIQVLNLSLTCYWKLNSISTTHSFIKVSLSKAYISMCNFDIIFLSEAYINSSIICDDDNLEISGYDLIRVDHPSNSRQGGVSANYKNSQPLKPLDIRYLNEFIVFELPIGKKICNFNIV